MQKKTLAIAIASALAVPMAAQAVNVKLSGQVNRAIMFADDGEASDILHVDNDNSSTRFRFTGSEKIGNGVTAGVVWEVQMESNTSSGVTIKQAGDIGGGSFTERKMDIFFSGGWGKVTFGQGDGAGNGTIERDLSGTVVAALASRQTVGGSIVYRTSAGGASAAGDVNDNYNHLDAFSRTDRIRYDTPTLGPGIVGSVSASNNDTWEVAGSIRTSLAGGKLDGALHYASGDNRFGFSNYGGSISYLFSQGTNITFHYAERDLDSPAAGRDDPTTWGAKLGHKWGNHAVSLDYSSAQDFAVNDRDTDTFGLAWVYTLPKPKIELYALYRNWDLDAETGLAGGDPEDIDIVMVGSRIKF